MTRRRRLAPASRSFSSSCTMPAFLRRRIALLGSALLVSATLAGCVSRNVETISSEEAASIPAPPEPLDQAQRAASVAELPGIDGTVEAAPDAIVPPGVLFMIVRVAGRESGPPLAVKQLPGELPASFRVTEADSMVPGTPLVGDLDVIARFDQDGNAFSRQPGDLEGRAGPVQVGATVQILLRPAEAAAAPAGR